MKNPAAQQLGRLSKGKPKIITPAERRRRQQAMREMNRKREGAKA